MSKSLRRQLADALHELRAKENAVEEAVHERDLRIRDLEIENHRLGKVLREAQREIHALAAFGEASMLRASETVASIESAFGAGHQVLPLASRGVG